MLSNFNYVDCTYNSVFFVICSSLFSTHLSNLDSRIMCSKKRIKKNMNAINFCGTYFFHLSSCKWPIVPPLFYTLKLFKGTSQLSCLFMLHALRLVNKFEVKGGTKNWFSPIYTRPFCSLFF